jgi:hypothetical protein
MKNAWKCYKKALCAAILNNISLFSFTKLENRRTEQVPPWEGWCQWEGEDGERG